MVEQVQVTPPPYDALSAPGTAVNDPKVANGHNGTNSATAVNANDTVTLSASARASQLYHEGKSITEISALLGLPPSTVDSVLNLSQSGEANANAVDATTAQSSGSQVTPADASTPSNVTSSPYIAPTHTTNKVS